MSAFIDRHRDQFGVEPICQTLDVSASAFYQRATGERSARVVEDERLTGRIREVHEPTMSATGTGARMLSSSARARPRDAIRSRG